MEGNNNFNVDGRQSQFVARQGYHNQTQHSMHCKYFEGVRTFGKRFASDILFTEGIETKVSKTLSKCFQSFSIRNIKN
jgi:hypothetical protein